MNARRKKSGARAVPARKAASPRPSVRAASKPSSAKKTARASSPVAKRGAKASAKHAAGKAKARATLLGADCTIEHAPALHAQLAKVLADRACVTLDFSAVKRCDTAGLQLLAAFIRERREAGLDVALTGTSENFQATANVLGLAALFDAAPAAAMPAAGIA